MEALPHLIMNALSLEDAAFRTEKDVQDGKTDGTDNANNNNNNNKEPTTRRRTQSTPQKKSESTARPSKNKPPSKSDHKTERKKIELPKWVPDDYVSACSRCNQPFSFLRFRVSNYKIYFKFPVPCPSSKESQSYTHYRTIIEKLLTELMILFEKINQNFGQFSACQSY